MSDLPCRPRLGRALAALLALAWLTGCQSSAAPTPPSDPPTALPASGTPRPTGTPVPPLPYPISGMPLCQGLKELPAPVPIEWPNIEEAYTKLARYNWGYYTCDLPVADLKSLIGEGMTKPPYLWTDINRAQYKTGEVHSYFQSIQVIWVYVWLLPAPAGPGSLLVIAKSDAGEWETWECRLRPPSPMNPTGLAALPPAPYIAKQGPRS